VTEVPAFFICPLPAVPLWQDTSGAFSVEFLPVRDVAVAEILHRMKELW